MGYTGGYPYDDQYAQMYDEPVIPGLDVSRLAEP
jgi:hypothetical protein